MSFKTEVDKLHLMCRIPPICFCKVLLEHTHAHSHIVYNNKVDCRVVTEAVWPRNSKLFTICLLKKELDDLCYKNNKNNSKVLILKVEVEIQDEFCLKY